MRTWRLMLFAILALCVAGGAFINKHGVSPETLVPTILFLSPFFISALLLFAATFCRLDAGGRVAEGTLLWKILKKFPREELREVDGEKVYVKAPRESLRICPSYWMVTGIVFFSEMVLALLVILSGSVWTQLAAGNGIHIPWRDIIILISVILTGVVLLVVIWALGRLDSRPLNIAIGTAVIGAFGGFISLAVLSDYADQGVEPADVVSLLASRVDFGTLAAVLGGVVLGLGFIIGFLWLCIRMFPWFRNSALGKLIAALYNRLCPTLLIAPASSVQIADTAR